MCCHARHGRSALTAYNGAVPVYESNTFRLLSQLWRVFEDPDPAKSWSTEFLVSLAGHDGTVNCVRFSPNGASPAAAVFKFPLFEAGSASMGSVSHS